MYDCIAQTEVKDTIADSFTDGKSQNQNKLFWVLKALGVP